MCWIYSSSQLWKQHPTPALPSLNNNSHPPKLQKTSHVTPRLNGHFMIFMIFHGPFLSVFSIFFIRRVFLSSSTSRQNPAGPSGPQRVQWPPTPGLKRGPGVSWIWRSALVTYPSEQYMVNDMVNHNLVGSWWLIYGYYMVNDMVNDG